MVQHQILDHGLVLRREAEEPGKEVVEVASKDQGVQPLGEARGQRCRRRRSGHVGVTSHRPLPAPADLERLELRAEANKVDDLLEGFEARFEVEFEVCEGEKGECAGEGGGADGACYFVARRTEGESRRAC